MPVPEAAINEYDCIESGKFEIWLSGQAFCMQRISYAACVKSFSDLDFRFGVLSSNSRHHATTGFGIDYIRQLS